jgi:thiol:disulfide interchange protein
MLKRKLLILALTLQVLSLQAQIYNPATWEFSYEKKSGNSYELVFTANIEKGSHIYSLDVPEGGPIPTTFTFDTLPGFSLEGTTFEVTTPEEKLDDAFGFKIKSFADKAEFRQKVIGRSPSFSVKGSVNFMSCNNSTCSPPQDVEFKINIGNTIIGETTSDKNIPVPVSDNEPVRRGLLAFFLISMLAGFAGILTPCVFPMIPLTVAFFSRGTENRGRSLINALVFGFSIILIYTSLGLVVSLTSAGAGFANALSTHWIPNIIFFLLFLIFSVSFFGAFEIVLPNKWASSADSKVDRGGFLAAFFMGLTTVIVSFSCTGPIIGALLVEAARGDVLRPTAGMFGFGLAFAIPFTLLALFPALLDKLPKSGGWLNSIKVILGFLMLAFSMKFLMTIDSVYSLGLLSRDLYLAIWIVLFFLLGLYLMGKIKFAHDTDLPHIGTFRMFLIIVVFSFVVYLVTGLFGAPLRGLSALLPPQETSWFSRHEPLRNSGSGSPGLILGTSQSTLCSQPKYSDVFTMPLGLSGYFDFRQGLACAEEQNKPVLLDFKGHACANCKVMEAKVWSDPQVLERLREKFVIISLYADDRTQLPENEWYTSTVDGKIKKTIGKQVEDLEISKFGTNALPLYVITDHEGNPLNKPMPANFSIEEYRNWLDDGIQLFNEK